MNQHITEQAIMNFNVGGFSESLKCSYQQFCKQETEGRESSRRLLVKLKKFEAKSFDLVAQTQSAQQMRNQFEKMFMQHNPLFWAQLQRNIATNTVDLNVDYPLSGCSGKKQTKEMAVNTSHNSSTSEQHSFHEEGIWPHTPSPTIDKGMQQMACDNTRNINIFSSTPHHKDQSENQDIRKDRRITNSNLVPNHKTTRHISSPQGVEEIKQVSSSTLEIHHPPQNFITSQQENQFASSNNTFSNATNKEEASCGPLTTTSIANFRQMNKESSEKILEHYLDKQKEEKEILSLLSPSEIKHPSMQTAVIPVIDPVDREPQDTNNVQNYIQELQSNTTVVDEVTQLVPASLSPNKMKPFRLDSDSDCADDPISGPLSGKNVGDDDSDSFWN